ncbi:hypothetical protein BKA82DRAFT_727717 [Pisolithus tinctorius]|nr:hypothetical protein BKA82DRAFT_727717 [Pisolithus tinctorius]
MTQAVIKVLSTRVLTRDFPGRPLYGFLAVVTVAHSLQGGLGWAARPLHLSTESGNHSGFPPFRPTCIPVTPHTPRLALNDTLPTKSSFRHPGSRHRSSPYLQIPHLTNFS